MGAGRKAKEKRLGENEDLVFVSETLLADIKGGSCTCVRRGNNGIVVDEQHVLMQDLMYHCRAETSDCL